MEKQGELQSNDNDDESVDTTQSKKDYLKHLEDKLNTLMSATNQETLPAPSPI